MSSSPSSLEEEESPETEVVSGSDLEGEEGDDEEEEFDEEDEEEETPDVSPDMRVLRDRKNQSKRYQELLAQEDGDEFWQHETWHEEANDEDWATDNERHYRDVFDSDFGEPTESSSSEAESEADRQNDGSPRKKRRIDPREARDRRRKMIITYIRKSKEEKASAGAKQLREQLMEKLSAGKKHNQQRMEAEAMRRSVPPPKPRMVLTRSSKKKGKAPTLVTQGDHLAAAARQEQETKKKLKELEEQATWQALVATQPKKTTHLYSGPAELCISWDSNRLMEQEEDRLVRRGEVPWAERERQGRELNIFIDFSDPKKSTLPPYLLSHGEPPPKPQAPICAVSGQMAAFRDPLTGAYYGDSAAFRILRKNYHQAMDHFFSEQLAELEQLIFGPDPDARLKNISMQLYSPRWSPMKFSQAKRSMALQRGQQYEVSQDPVGSGDASQGVFQEDGSLIQQSMRGVAAEGFSLMGDAAGDLVHFPNESYHGSLQLGNACWAPGGDMASLGRHEGGHGFAGFNHTENPGGLAAGSRPVDEGMVMQADQTADVASLLLKQQPGLDSRSFR